MTTTTTQTIVVARPEVIAMPVLRKLFWLIALMTITFNLAAQKVNIQWVQIIGDKIIVHYDLEDTNPNHEYTISLLSSKDNFAAPLTKVTGDVGNEVRPGTNKKITWDITKELGFYKGDLELEIKGKFYLPFLKLTNFDSSKKYKKGKNYPLVWSSGNMSGQIDIELYNGQDRVHRESNVANSGKYDFLIPNTIKPGSDYRFKFTNTKNRDEVIYSDSFKVGAKIPLAMKIGGIAVIGGAAALLGGGGGGSGGGGGGTPTGGNLPGHPDTP
jgi:hypothetical protein